MNYELRPYQSKGSEFLQTKRRAILAMDPGLGKTLTTLDALSKFQPKPHRILLLAGINPQFVWEEEIQKWNLDHRLLFIGGVAAKRAELWKTISQAHSEPFFAVTTIQSLQRDIQLAKDIVWDCVIMDECHKARNRKTKNYEILRTITSSCPTVYLLSGSIVSRGPQDLWAPLNVLDRKKFNSYWNWVNRYCHVVETFFGNEIGGPKNLKELKALCAEYIYYVSKAHPEVAATIPVKNRQLLQVRATPEQTKLYNQLTEEMIASLGDDLVITPSKLSMITRHRQLLICPRILFSGAGLGAAWDAVMEMVEEASRDDQHCIIYSPFVEAFPHWEQDLKHKGIETVVTFKGGMSRDEIKDAKALFVRSKGIALMSIAYAESISLESASYGYFIGADWDPNVNYQAEDRIHRMTSQKPVFYYYFNYPGTITEWQFEVLGMKKRNMDATITGEYKLKNLLGSPLKSS